MQTITRASVLLASAALASLALIVAGCGGDSEGPGIAQVGTSSTTTEPSADSETEDEGNPAAFSACMRKNGVPEFPDPNPEGGIRLRAGPGTGIDPESAEFKAAEKACRKLLPRGGEEASPAQQAQARERMLAFSACMRKNGVPNFPDPEFDGGAVRLRLPRGFEANSPQFKDAEKACQDLLPGVARGQRQLP
jgi:hypothetical protein